MCTIISIGLENSKSQKDRRAVLAGSTLTLTHGRNTKDIASYRCVEIPGVPFPARGFELTKVAGGTDKEADSYAVLIDPTATPTCECKGFLYHGRCKHIVSVVEMLAAGAFDPEPANDPDYPVSEYPSAEQLADDAQHDLPECFRNCSPTTANVPF